LRKGTLAVPGIRIPKEICCGKELYLFRVQIRVPDGICVAQEISLLKYRYYEESEKEFSLFQVQIL
jgi:hypothetical protein